MTDLPIHAVLPDLLAALASQAPAALPNAVLIAPPGAGKTTTVATALLGQDWCRGTVILLSPRRVAARAAAERMADLLGEAPGETVGYLTRLDSKRSARTRVLVMTEAIFVATILSDPELSGISAVLFDEAHERHLDSDLGLALALEAQGVLREDLRVVVMSATLDGARFAALMGRDTPVIESAGKAHPLRIRWLGSNPQLRTEQAMANAIATAWAEETGDILAFLPGVRDIDRTADILAQRLPTALVLPLHGQVEPAGQRAAIRRDAQGRRRVVLATAIAETSLTLDGVAVVVDAGLSRRAEFDKVAGVTRLVTTRASQAAAAQRAGRAARQGPGVAYRLWEEAAHAGRAPFDPPEMLTSDLAPLALTLAQWGAGDPAAMAWIDPPPAAAMATAQASLQALGALDEERRITAHGRAMARLPMEPALAHMLIYAARHGAAGDAARLALLLQERGLGGSGEDLARRFDRWQGDRSGRAEASRKLAARWAGLAERAASGSFDKLSPNGLSERNNPSTPVRAEPAEGRQRNAGRPPLAVLLAEAFPDRIARARSASGEEWLASGGRGYRLDPASPLATARWLVIGEAQGEAKGARIMSALALDEEDVTTWLAHRMDQRHTLSWNAAEGRVEARLERRLGAIVLARVPDPVPDPAAMTALLLDVVRREGLSALPLGGAAQALLTRARYAGLAALDEAALLADLDAWLAPLLSGRRDLAVSPGKLHEALENRLDWNERQALDRLAPPQFRSPAGTTHAIDYGHEGGPAVELRVQALFGLDRHPMIGQPPRPLLLSLTSPAGRPIQTTADLPAFWRGSWRDVVKDMKGRYPRHRWPDQPWAEDPSLKTRNAFEATRKG
ncbi:MULTISPECIES: ATP-dependent helicase HrpB [unclassified Novosphingobium]|uniref:ATP-dependent helicase HrpB n=1 Tax=unclassified Novosphingobium TaxID=2644732 RepID=UPI00146A1A13|nr:ATP-dependent helicase HrpB [Novosphingobium sp. SG919]NMN86610.1 ATP-dependent helicase HrpB [Novosphingobium sp. SG916]